MALYTERHGMRKPIKKTSIITLEMYILLFSCCEKYYNNIAWKFPLRSHCDFVNQDYIEFNKMQFQNMVSIEIPTLFRDVYGNIATPDKGNYGNGRDQKYDQYALLDYIEYIAQEIRDISEGWNNDRYRNYWDISCFETSNIFESYQDEINNIFEKKDCCLH